MIANYLTIIIRNLGRNKSFFVINTLGLAVGLTSAVLILLYIHHETSFENQHSKADRIFRLSMRFEGNNFEQHWARLNTDWINSLPQEFPEVEYLVRFQDYYPRNFQIGERNFRLEHAFTVDPDVFKVFDFRLIQGDPGVALKDPNSMVLTETTAFKFFGRENPMGKKVFLIQDEGGEVIKKTYEVTGVMEDLPSNTHLLITSFESPSQRVGWAYTYIQLPNAAAAKTLEGKLGAFIDKNLKASEKNGLSFPLQSLSEIHLNSNLAREIVPNGSRLYVFVFGAVALLILLMAVINFANLSTAQFLRRSKEVGVRKVLGSTRSNLMTYFLGESFVLSLFASLIALMAVLVLFPYLRELTGTQIEPDPYLAILYLLTLAIIVGFSSGYYPGLVLSRLNPIMALKGKRGGREKANGHPTTGFSDQPIFRFVICTSS